MDELKGLDEKTQRFILKVRALIKNEHQRNTGNRYTPYTTRAMYKEKSMQISIHLCTLYVIQTSPVTERQCPK